VAATARWTDGQAGRLVEAGDVDQLWAEVEAEVSRPLVLVLEAGGAEIAAVIGDAHGTVLTYIPASYGATGTDHYTALAIQLQPNGMSGSRL
jgi:hypothetical protein